MSDIDANASVGDSEESQRKTEAYSEAVGKASLGEVLAVVDAIVRQHGSVLVAKRRQKMYRDDYGRLIDDAWQSEIAYFQANIVKDELFRQCQVLVTAQAEVYTCLSTPEHLREALGCPKSDYYFDLSLRTYIDTLVQELDAQTPDSALDAGELLTRPLFI